MQPTSHPLTSNRAGSYITFQAGSAHYSLLAECVRYITSMDSIKTREAPNGMGSTHQLFEFEGQPIVLYRFCDLVGTNSLIDECADLIELLKQRRQDHINWVETLEHSIESGEPFTKATDPHKCAFGLWYDQYKTNDHELKEILAGFDEPHRRIHSLAKSLLRMVEEQGNVKEALDILKTERYTTLKTLLALFTQVENRLLDMVKPVVLIVNNGDQMFALELDNIENIHEFEDQHWLPDSPNRTKSQLCYDGFFQKEEGQLFIKLDPKQLV